MDYRVAYNIPEYSNTRETIYRTVPQTQLYRLNFMSNARTRNKNFLKAINNNSNTEQGKYQMWHTQCQNLR